MSCENKVWPEQNIYWFQWFGLLRQEHCRQSQLESSRADDDDTIAGEALQPFTAAGRVLGTTDYHDRVCSGSFATPETADDVGGATGDDEAVSEEQSVADVRWSDFRREQKLWKPRWKCNIVLRKSEELSE